MYMAWKATAPSVKPKSTSQSTIYGYGNEWQGGMVFILQSYTNVVILKISVLFVGYYASQIVVS